MQQQKKQNISNGIYKTLIFKFYFSVLRLFISSKLPFKCFAGINFHKNSIQANFTA